MAQAIREAGMEDCVMLQSFDAESVRIMHGLLPETPAGVLPGYLDSGPGGPRPAHSGAGS